MLPRDAILRAIRRLDYRPPSHLVDAVELEFELDPQATRVTSRFAYRRNPAGLPGQPLTLNGERQQLLEIRCDGRRLDADEYVLTGSDLLLPRVPDAGTLEIRSVISPAANTALEGLYLSSGVFCTQCEAEGFRRITYFPDRPDVLARHTVKIVADKSLYPVLLSNGNLIERGDLRGNEREVLHYAKWHDPFPKPSYLFALVAGDLASLDDEYTTMSGRVVKLQIFSTPANLDKCRYAIACLKRAMRWDEERFGREYDLDTFMIFCADDFNMGAMENKGLNIFNSKLVLAHPDTATDADYQAIQAAVGHEYFHNWTGNRVTCRDWFQLSLKEGLTVFRDQELSSDLGSRAVERIRAVNFLRAQQFPEDAGPMAHPVRPDSYLEINNFYTATVYEKGAEVIRMQHALLGPAAFRRGMDLYFARHDGQAVTCDDFVQAMQDASGVDLGQFKRWYSQAGTPMLTIRGTYDPAARSYTLGVAQACLPTPGQPEKEPLHIPLAVGLVGSDGRDLPLRLEGEPAACGTTRVLHLREREQHFRFIDVATAPVPSLLRGFSAPAKLDFAYTERELAFLAAHDSDAVTRWDAAQRLYCGAILAQAVRRRDRLPLALDATLSGLARALLADTASDPALIALALTPPGFSVLAEQQQTIDADGLHAACEFILAALSRALRADFARVFDANRTPGPYAPEPAAIARRSLKNVCLGHLAAIDDAPARALAYAQFDAADNMTDALAALAALNESAGPERAAALARFESRWRDDPLVMDHWLSLQATSSRSGTLDQVRILTRHRAYDPRSPNRIRALIGAFALRNWPRFHDASGSGYAFVADQVLAIDQTNPQVAARIVAALCRWRRFDAARGALQRRELERIAAAPELSPDVLEIVTKSLAA